MSLKSIGFIGDLHCGSHYGLWPVEDLPGGKRGTKYKGIRYLNTCFADMVDKWPDLDLLILMGDLIDGKQRKSSGCGIFTSNLNEQVNGAIETLRPLTAKAKKIIRVHGTPYHEEFDDCLSSLDKSLGVSRAEQIMNVNVGGHILNVAHHPIGGSTLYMGTAVDKETIWSNVAFAEKTVPHARWIVRAHKHCWIHQETRHKDVCILPCFELPTPHAVKVNYWKFQPVIGGALLLRDDSPVMQHDTGYRMLATTYDVPLPSIYNYDQL
jgi:hypothetical protein